MTKRHGLTLSAALLLGAAGGATAQETKVCLSGVCLGAAVSQLPTTIKWEPIQVSPKNALFRGPEYDTLMASYLRADSSVLEQLRQYRNAMGNIAGLNAGVIASLQKVRGSCFRFTLDGRFYSDSHHLTTVTVKPYPSAGRQMQVFQVSQIVRVYEDAVTQEQKTSLQQSVEGQLGVPFGAGRVLYNDRNQVNTKPNVDFSLGSPTSVFIGDLVATVYHCANLLYLYTSDVGVALALTADGSTSYATIESGYQNSALTGTSRPGYTNLLPFPTTVTSSYLGVYPLPGQVGVRLHMEPETPSPFPGFSAGQFSTNIGYPVSVAGPTNSVTTVSTFTVTQAGAAAPLQTILITASDPDFGGNNNFAFIVAAQQFLPNTTYNVTFVGTSNGAQVSKSWSFTAGNDAI